MGGLLSAFAGWVFGGPAKVGVSPADLGSESDIASKATGLTPRQVAYVQTTWALVTPNLKEHGIAFFILFFKMNPELQKLFKSFANVSEADLPTNKRMAAHGLTVLTAIDSYVKTIDDPECLVSMLHTTGQNHNLRGITPEQFKKLPPVLLKYFEQNLGDAWSPAAKEAWTKLLQTILSIIFTQY